jgi:tetratricopeptide (TPR) repeat protein
VLLAALLARAGAAGAPPAPPMAPPDTAGGRFDLAIAAAEASLRQGQREPAQRAYRLALFEGWLSLGALERLEGRPAEAGAALAQAARFAGEDVVSRRSLAGAYLLAGDTAASLAILTPLAAQHPRDAETRRVQAKALAASGRLDRALLALDEASALAEGDPEVQFLLASEYLWLGKPEAAERLFARVLAARPIPQTRVLIGRAYRDAREYERARRELRAALAQDPRVRRAHYYLGMVVQADARTGPERLEQAIAEFRAELRLAPGDAVAGDQLGAALLDAGRPAEALPVLEAAARERPRARYLYHLGRAQLALERTAEAVVSLRRALTLAREQGAEGAELERTHYQLGLALRKQGAAREAATHLAEAGRIAAARADGDARTGQGPAEALAELSVAERQELRRRLTGALPRAYLNLGVMEAQEERFAEAAALFEQAAALDPDFPQVQRSLGVAYFNAKQWDKATAPLTRAHAASPEDAAMKRMLALAWLNTGVYDRAADLLRDDPALGSDPSLQFAYGLVLVRSGRAAEAEPIFSRLVAENAESAELGVLLGQAHAQQGDYDAAVASLQRALRLKPGVAEANATLGVIYLKQGRLPEAEAALRAETGSHPGDTQSRHHLAMVLEMQGRPEEAVPLLRDVVGASPDLADARYLLGKILLAQGSAAEAASHLEAAARLDPEAANVHYQLGQAYTKLGRAEDAQRQFERFRVLKDRARETP